VDGVPLSLSCKLNQVVEYSAAQLDAVYAAISHPVRRSVLERLRPGGATVSELAAPHAMSLAAVSKHIRVLEDAGLVRRSIVGREHHLALEPSPLRSAAGWLDTYRRFWDERLDLLEARLREPRG
jgi:DNA-binding transcriptional ArsR family regulator